MVRVNLGMRMGRDLGGMIVSELVGIHEGE